MSMNRTQTHKNQPYSRTVKLYFVDDSVAGFSFLRVLRERASSV